MDIRIGELRHRVTFERMERAFDGQGGFQIQWVALQSCWAKIENKGATERVFGEKIEENRIFLITIRNTLDHEIQMSMDRIKFGDRYFHIKGIQYADERKFWIQLTCAEGVAS